ncbi:hypothetical protein [uncultured Succinivibrio sp.]|uniref:hypothetical protein n=1 Tax=uncultured Succinivibrio sp. TaxID=540749 RepID=UPI0025D9A94E|nr:hypothetical protein [uncultured Succinivibrio sp.]
MRVQGLSSDGSSAPVADSKDDLKTRGDDYWSNQKKEQFEKEMSRKEGAGSDKNNGDSQRKDSDMSSMFSSFAKQASSMTSSSVNAASQSSSVGTQTELQQLVTSLVDKILVSQPRLDGAHQVMLQLNDTVLTDTSITLTRDVTGMLFVNIVSSDPLSFKKLMATKDMLEADLDTHEKNAFRVEVSFDGIEAEGVHNDIRGLAGNSDAVLKDGENDNV